MKTTDQLSAQLDLINERLDEIEDTVRSVRHAQKMAVFWKLMYYLLLIGIGIGFFVWIRPLIETAQQGIQEIQGTFLNTQANFENVSDQFKGFFGGGDEPVEEPAQ